MDQIKAIHVGEGEVDDHGIVDSLDGEPLGVTAAGAGIDVETALGERTREEVANCVVVFDYQEAQADSVPFPYTLSARPASSKASSQKRLDECTASST